MIGFYDYNEGDYKPLNTNTNALKKGCLIVIAIILLIAVAGWGYWEYLGYKLDKDPQYYYKPRTIEHAHP